MTATRPRIAAALLALCAVWGYSWIAMKIALAHAHPFDFAAHRLVLGAALLFAIARATGRRLSLPDYRLAAMLGLLQVGAFVLLSHYALLVAGPGKTAVLTYTMPFWMLVFAAVLLGERMRGLQWLSVGAAFAGLVLIVSPWKLTSLEGSLLAVGSGAVWALAAVMSKRWPAKGTDLLVLTAWQLLIGAIPFVALSLGHEHAATRWNGEYALALFYSTVFATAGGWLLWTFVLANAPAGVAGLNALGVPVFALAASWLQMGERPPPHELAGMALIGFALAFLAWAGLAKAAAAARDGPSDGCAPASGDAPAPLGAGSLSAVRRAAVVVLLAGALAALVAFALGRTLPVDLPGAGGARLPCVSYAPFRRAGDSPFDPALRVAPEQIEADLRLLAGKTGCVRTYGLDHGIDAVPGIARKLGLRVILGAWIGRDPVANDIQLERALELARTHGDVIDLLVIGNEVLLRRELAPQALAALLGRAREASQVPVAYADVWEFWLRHAPELRGHVDVVVAHILPYWEDRPVAVDVAVDHVYDIAAQLGAAFAPLPVYIGETGWPAAGRQRGPAAPGTLEQTRFVRELLARQAERPLPFNLIEGFDQPWKRALEGAMGGAWGVFDAGGNARVTMAGPVVPDARARWILVGAGFGAAAGLAVLALARARRAALAWRGATLALAGALVGALGVVQWQALEAWSRSPLEWTLGGLTAALAALCSVSAAWRLAGAHDPPRPARTGIATALRAGKNGSRNGAWILFAWLFAVAAMALGLVFDPRYRPLEWWNLAGAAALLLALAVARDGLDADAREERLLAAVCALCAPVIALQEGAANTPAMLVAGLLLVTALAVAWPRRRAGDGAGRTRTGAGSDGSKA